MSNEETKDCTRLPVVATIFERDGKAYRMEFSGLAASTGAVFVQGDQRQLTYLDDAQARLAEKDARIAQLAAHARGKNKALANALKEIERLKRTIETGLDNELALVGERTELRAQLEQLQAAPAERGVVVLPALKVVEQAWGYDDGGNYAEGFAEGYNDAIDDVQRLNPAPATADSDAQEVSE